MFLTLREMDRSVKVGMSHAWMTIRGWTVSSRLELDPAVVRAVIVHIDIDGETGLDPQAFISLELPMSFSVARG